MDFLYRLFYSLVEVHPFHTLVVHFPIALTTTALFFVFLALVLRNDKLEQAAFANIALAALSTVAAGISGYHDNLTNYDGAAPNATVKIILAIILFLVTTITALARWRKADLFHSRLKGLYVGAYFASFSLAATLGFLGGVILYGFPAVPTVNADEPETAGEVALVPSPTVQLLAATTPQPDAGAETGTPIPVSFKKDILPILRSRCTNCHGTEKTEEDLNLTSYSHVMAGSKNGAIVVPGDVKKSPFVQLLLNNKMPKRGPKLLLPQVELFEEWVEAGAPDN